MAGSGLLELCPACQSDLPRAPAWQIPGSGFERTCCPWAYRWPVDQLVRALKFAGERSHARLLGTLLAHERLALGPPWPQLLVPVPLHVLRLRERGYNQAAELARFAGHAIGLPVHAQALERVRATREQSGLGASGRAANVAGAFGARRPLAGLRVALIDDVVTTGSTVAAAAQALRAAGASAVELWAVAHAIRRRDAVDVPGAAQWPDV
jgi:ComF family protein